MPKALSLLKAALITTAILGVPYLGMPTTPKLAKHDAETLDHYKARYAIAQAEEYLYAPKYTFQRWRGLMKLNSFIEDAKPEWQTQAYTSIFNYYRYGGVRPAEWQQRDWHEPLRRNNVEKAANAALQLNEVNPEKAAELLADFIIYPVTVPAIPQEAINIVRTSAEAGTPLSVKAMVTYCTDDRFWHPCPKAETQKWQGAIKALTGTE